MREIANEGVSLVLLPATAAGEPVILAGARLAELHLTNAAVELSVCNGHGWREYLPRAGTRSVSLLIRGLVLHQAAEQCLQLLALTGAVQACRLELEGGLQLQGPFIVREFSISDQHGDDVTFKLGLESSGQISTGP